MESISMYGWSSVGSSSYHALQVNLKKQVSHGLQFDLNYTWSKSIDITSAASRVGFSVYGYQNVGLVGTRLANAFSPNLARAVSDFDSTHQFNLNWVAELPWAEVAPLPAAPVACWTLSSAAGRLPESLATPADSPSAWMVASAGPQTGS